MAASAARSSTSPSSTYSIAGRSLDSTSCSTRETSHAEGTSTSPASTCSSPQSNAKNEVLPQPFEPTTPSFWPAWTMRSASWSSSFWPRLRAACRSRITGLRAGR